MKKYIIIFLYWFTVFTTKVFASEPGVVCDGLPGCSGGVTGKKFFSFIGNLISEGIKYVAVIAVLAVMISGIMYLLSIGEEEKTKKAKNWITWSLVGVLISTSAWAIINILNRLNIS